MTDSSRPLLALGAPAIGDRLTQRPSIPPSVSGPGSRRQGERLGPQFKSLVDAFANQRAALFQGQSDEVDPELVLVFDLAGTVSDFHKAINRVDGLEFLTELLEADTEPDDEFFKSNRDGRVEGKVEHSLQLVMSNHEAAGQLVTLFEQWCADPSMKFPHGLAKFRAAFHQLRAIRRWGTQDRIRETGLLEAWRERLEMTGQSHSSVLVEVELWFRRKADDRLAAERHLSEIIGTAGGRIRHQSQIPAISYHAMLVELPIQQVRTVLERGADSIHLLTTDEVMLVSPSTPMTFPYPTDHPLSSTNLPVVGASEGAPRVALLDGLPFVNHHTLADRLVVDDPDGLTENYPVSARHHGTAMASLIIHGDLSSPGDPLERPLYVRPILKPHEFVAGHEIAIDDVLFPDLLHRAIRRIVEGDSDRPAAAPSVRVINLSIGTATRALVRRMSPAGRLLDWLAVEYNLLFIVSAGNHSSPLSIPATEIETVESARSAALLAARNGARHRGILPPGDALNALTVGAIHGDGSGEISLPDTAWDLTREGAPALYGAVGPGVGRSIKPDLHHLGGRAVYARPVDAADDANVFLNLLYTPQTGPGIQVSAPGRGGATNATAFTHGTSNATALVSREASRMFDILEGGAGTEDLSFPDAQYHPVLVKALLVHASSWGEEGSYLKRVLGLDPQRARRELTALLGYGALNTDRLGNGSTNRVALISGGSIGRDQRHTYEVPLPPSLRSRRDWHRITVTLACMAPTAGQLARYRGAKVFFESLDDQITAGARTEAEHYAVRRGTVQHEIIEGSRAMVFGENGTLPIHVQCMNDGQTLRKGKLVRDGVVVSIETAVETSTTIYDEVRARLRTRVRAEARGRIQN